MQELTAKIKQYKNLILVAALAAFFIALLCGDPLGFFARRAHERAAIHNQMAIERAEAEKEIALIQARTEAELKRIESGDVPVLQMAPEEATEEEGT